MLSEGIKRQEIEYEVMNLCLLYFISNFIWAVVVTKVYMGKSVKMKQCNHPIRSKIYIHIKNYSL